MVNTSSFDILIFDVFYDPKLNPNKPNFNLRRCIKHASGPINFWEYENNWCGLKLELEASKVPHNTSKIVDEWDVTIGDADLFKVRNTRFEKITVMVGVDTIHWIYCYLNSDYGSIQGSMPLEMNFCPCCISVQYSDIMQLVKQDLKKQLKAESSTEFENDLWLNLKDN